MKRVPPRRSSLETYQRRITSFGKIFQFCTHRESSNKKEFPTFARTRPPDTQISKSVVSVLMAFNWTKVSRTIFISWERNTILQSCLSSRVIDEFKGYNFDKIKNTGRDIGVSQSLLLNIQIASLQALR